MKQQALEQDSGIAELETRCEQEIARLQSDNDNSHLIESLKKALNYSRTHRNIPGMGRYTKMAAILNAVKDF